MDDKFKCVIFVSHYFFINFAAFYDCYKDCYKKKGIERYIKLIRNNLILSLSSIFDCGTNLLDAN